MPSAGSTRWIEIAVESHPEAVEAVSEILDRVGYNGIAVDVPLEPSRPHVVKAYLVSEHGARPVVGLDVDPLAVKAARENAERNAVGVEVREGSADAVDGRFDVVLANLVADVLVAIAPDLRARLADGGALVCAGIVAEKESRVAEALGSVGLRTAERDQRDDWVSLQVR